MRLRSTASFPLRRALFLLAAAGILPLAVMAGVSLYALIHQQRAQAERVGLELARAVATVVDAELRSSISVLESLATSTALDRGDLPEFLERARRVLQTRPHWAGIQLADPTGTRLADTRLGHGPGLPPIVERESFDRVVLTRAPTVGSLDKSPRGILLFGVRVPVVRAGTLRYVLTAAVDPEEIRAVVTRQRVPDDWVISIVDAAGRRVARSRAHQENLGGQLAPSVQALVARGTAEGFGVAYTLEGNRIFTPYSRLAPWGWAAVLGIPTAQVERAVYRSVAVYGGGLLLSMLVGTAAALWVARRVSRPIAGLRVAAQALGRGESPMPPATSIQEIHDVAAELVSAAAAREKAEVLREELLSKERHARERAEAADRAKDEFLAVLSHELRTPLNAVYGWARMLRDGQIRDDGAEQALDAIVRNANAQVQLIDDLLDVSRVITGKMRLDVGPVDLRAVVEGALDAVRPAAEAKEIRLQIVLDPRAGPIIGDSARLQQVVWNLVMNAVKFTPKGGRIQVHLQRVNSHVEIVVSDTGQGIAPEILAFVFDRFRQADSSSTRTHSGLGLGLALVKHLVELHGGTVVAQSSGEGMGATFIVKLPIAIAEMPASAGPRPHPGTSSIDAAVPATMRLDGLRVLVVDDDPDAVMLAKAILAGAGATVRTCVSAADALRVLQDWRPVVLVSDIEMPDEDGYSLIRKVRALGPDDGGRTPAIALTAYGRAQDRMRSFAAGYNMHVPKPVDPAELVTIVASLAGRV